MVKYAFRYGHFFLALFEREKITNSQKKTLIQNIVEKFDIFSHSFFVSSLWTKWIKWTRRFFQTGLNCEYINSHIARKKNETHTWNYCLLQKSISDECGHQLQQKHVLSWWKSNNKQTHRTTTEKNSHSKKKCVCHSRKGTRIDSTASARVFFCSATPFGCLWLPGN